VPASRTAGDVRYEVTDVTGRNDEGSRPSVGFSDGACPTPPTRRNTGRSARWWRAHA